MPGQNLKSLSELKFESIGEEFLYLHKNITKYNPEFEQENDDKKELTIEFLREEYSRISDVTKSRRNLNESHTRSIFTLLLRVAPPCNILFFITYTLLITGEIISTDRLGD